MEEKSGRVREEVGAVNWITCSAKMGEEVTQVFDICALAVLEPGEDKDRMTKVRNKPVRPMTLNCVSDYNSKLGVAKSETRLNGVRQVLTDRDKPCNTLSPGGDSNKGQDRPPTAWVKYRQSPAVGRRVSLSMYDTPLLSPLCFNNRDNLPSPVSSVKSFTTFSQPEKETGQNLPTTSPPPPPSSAQQTSLTKTGHLSTTASAKVTTVKMRTSKISRRTTLRACQGRAKPVPTPVSPIQSPISSTPSLRSPVSCLVSPNSHDPLALLHLKFANNSSIYSPTDSRATALHLANIPDKKVPVPPPPSSPQSPADSIVSPTTSHPLALLHQRFSHHASLSLQSPSFPETVPDAPALLHDKISHHSPYAGFDSHWPQV